MSELQANSWGPGVSWVHHSAHCSVETGKYSCFVVIDTGVSGHILFMRWYQLAFSNCFAVPCNVKYILLNYICQVLEEDVFCSYGRLVKQMMIWSFICEGIMENQTWNNSRLYDMFWVQPGNSCSYFFLFYIAVLVFWFLDFFFFFLRNEKWRNLPLVCPSVVSFSWGWKEK